MDKLIVEFNVNKDWEAGYVLKREQLDLLYKLADLLQFADTEGLDIDEIVYSIKSKHKEVCYE